MVNRKRPFTHTEGQSFINCFYWYSCWFDSDEYRFLILAFSIDIRKFHDGTTIRASIKRWPGLTWGNRVSEKGGLDIQYSGHTIFDTVEAGRCRSFCSGCQMEAMGPNYQYLLTLDAPLLRKFHLFCMSAASSVQLFCNKMTIWIRQWQNKLGPFILLIISSMTGPARQRNRLKNACFFVENLFSKKERKWYKLVGSIAFDSLTLLVNGKWRCQTIVSIVKSFCPLRSISTP